MEVPIDVVRERERKISDLKKLGIEAELVGNRIVVWEPKHGYALFQAGFFGKPLGIRKPKIYRYRAPYELSFYDTLYLMERDLLRVISKDRYMTREEIATIATRVVEDFKPKYIVYRDLRNRGFVVKPGLKYGADFVVYAYGPGIDHSLFAVSVFSHNVMLKGQDFLRSGRLSWSVRKRWVLACVVDENVKYFVFEWDKDLSV